MQLINLTPHDIIIMGEAETLTIPKSGEIARLSVSREQVDTIDGIPIFSTSYGEVEGLPAPQAGTAYIVSGLISSAVKGRDDLYSPGDLVRDAEGKVIGCRGLTKGGN